MDPPDRVVNSGGGTVFQGNITAGRDITINHITEIRQVTERLSSRCSEAYTSYKLFGTLEALSGAAEFTEDYVKELNASVFSNEPLLERVSRECASILSELKQLEHSLGQDENGGYVFSASLSENIVDIRSRLMSLQMLLSNINSRKNAKDFEAIKEAVTQLMNSHQSSDDASSIRSFFTASENPYVERQVWQEIEKALRARFTTNFVRDNYALIVASLEELVFENTAPWIVEEAKPIEEANPIEIPKLDALPSKALNTTITGITLRGSETYNIAPLYMEDIDVGLEEQFPEIEGYADDDASLRPLYVCRDRSADKTGVAWSKSVRDGTGESLLTLDGGGVKSYSSILIIEALMREVIACENRFEREFTHYPRTFDGSGFRPCHYFHKMYGTSTGGILAIALSRLRMTVRETITAFESILNAMYAHVRNLVPLATKYHHLYLQTRLVSMAQQYCKQHEPGLCNHEEKFRWRAPDDENHADGEDSDDSVVSNDLNIWRDRASRESTLNMFELQTPEYHLCQTICLTAAYSGQIDEPYLLRTYTHHYDPNIAPPWVITHNKDTADLYTWQVGRATTATPFLFEMLVVTGPQGRLGLKDGGIRENNPSWCAYSEAASLWGDDKNPTLLLSIGAGQTSSTADDISLSGIIPFGLSTLSKYAEKVAVFKNTLIKYTEGQDRHRLMRTIARGGHTWYKRFEVTHGLEKIRADQWERGMFSSVGEDEAVHLGGRTLNIIRTATEGYLKRREADKSAYEYAAPDRMLKQTAEKLVRMRRARELEAMTQGGEKRKQWEAFMGKHLPGEREFFQKYQEEWDYALLGRKN